MTELFTENLPPVRCTPLLKERLLLVVRKSITRNMADHIRFAVEQYVEREGTLQGIVERAEDGKEEKVGE